MRVGPARDGAGRRERLAASRLYVCTPIRPDLAGFADAVLGAGVDLIQLRDKQAEAGPLLEAAGVLRAAADRHGALFAVNDREQGPVPVGGGPQHARRLQQRTGLGLQIGRASCRERV